MITTTQAWSERAAENWNILVIGVAVAFFIIGWQAHRAFLRSRIQTRPVYATDGTIRGYRAYLGRLALGPLRQTQQEAENHADHLKDTP